MVRIFCLIVTLLLIPWPPVQANDASSIQQQVSSPSRLGLAETGIEYRAPKIVTYPTVPTAKQSGVYSLQVGTTPVFVEKFKDIHYAHFAFSGSPGDSAQHPLRDFRRIDVKVMMDEPIKEHSLSPESYNIPRGVCNNHLHILLSTPRKLVVQINGYERLFIFADPIETQNLKFKTQNSNVTNIMDFDVDNTGKTLVTDKIQKAIQATPKGGLLYFPPGIYLTGTVHLKSDMTLYLAGGALLQGSANPADYPLDEGRVESGTHKNMTYSRLVLVDNAENVTITGRGIIDGNGKIIRAAGKKANLIRIRNSKNVLLEDVILRDPAAWNTHILHSQNVTIRNIKMINDRGVGNTDGINPDSSCHVVIENNFAYCGDDSIAIKTTGNSDLLGDVDDIVVRGNVLLTRKTGLKIGTETLAEHIKNVSFIDNDIVECDRGMSLYCKDGATISDISYINNCFESCFKNNRQRMLDFYIEKRGGLGQIRNLLIKDCWFKTPWPQPSTMAGYDKKHTISDVRFENFRIADQLAHNSRQAHIQMNEHVHNVTFIVTKPIMPDFTIKGQSGRTITLSQLRGQIVLLDFWAAWCAPCRKKLPHIQQVYEQFKGQGLAVIGIHSAHRGEMMDEFIAEHNYTFPTAVDTGRIAKDYNVRGWPTYFLIDRRGQLVWGPEHAPPSQQLIQSLLKH
jgi:peroxiredoxin